jgi:hypothetical protein
MMKHGSTPRRGRGHTQAGTSDLKRIRTWGYTLKKLALTS